MKAPGTLDDEAQRALIAKVTQLIFEAYGAEVQFGIAIAKPIRHGDERGIALWTMGTTPHKDELVSLFAAAAAYMQCAEARVHAIEDPPQRPQ